MARLGDDVYDWKIDQVAEWLRSEGLDDCVEVFTQNRINGCKFVTLSEIDIKNLHVSHESKRTLFKVVEKFKKRKKGPVNRMFGENSQVQRVSLRKPTSISHDDGASDEDGWGSDEFSSGEDEEEDSDDGGEYLEPEDDFSKPTGSPYKKEIPPVIQTGLVAQLKIGIQQSMKRHSVPPAHDPSYEDEEDIYDVPPDEEEPHPFVCEGEDDLYEEPSDSSGGATVVRPPPKPPRVEDGPDYLPMRGEQQDTYEAPIEEKDTSQSPARNQTFIPTRVQPPGNTFRQQDINGNMETYDDPNFASDEDNYEIAEPQKTAEAPPPRPPKNIGKPVSTLNTSPARPPKQQPTRPNNSFKSQQPQKTVFCRPSPGTQPQQDTPKPPANSFSPQRSNQPKQSNNFSPKQPATFPSHGGHQPIQSNNFPPRQPASLPSHGGHQPKQSNNFPQRQPATLPSPDGPQRGPGQLPNKPTAPPKQRSPIHSSTQPPSPTRQTMAKLSSQGSAFQGIPLQPTPTPKQTSPARRPRPGQPQAIPTEENRPPIVPKTRPKLADPMKREPAPPPGTEPPQKTSGGSSYTGLPESPKRREPPRKTSDPPPRKASDPLPPRAEPHRPALPVPTPDAARTSPIPSPRGGMLAHKDPPPMSPPEPPQKSISSPPPHPPQPRRSGPLPATPGHERPPEPTPTEPAAPPRPPKQNATQPSQTNRSSHGDKKGVPLPPPPSGSLRDSREQSSGSSMESGSADEPVVPLGNKKSSGSHHHRGLPPTPTEKSPIDIMKNAPWFHGGVDRKRSEANLKAVNLDGAFLVRNSTKNPNEYSLSLLHGGQIRHLQIPKKDGQYVLGASGVQKFDSILDLVAFYRQNEIDLVKGGKTKLTVHAQNIAR